MLDFTKQVAHSQGMDHLEFLREAGRKGGKAGRGESKARSSMVARAAALKRWRPESRDVFKEIGQVVDAALPKNTGDEQEQGGTP